MPEATSQTLHHFALFSFTSAHSALPPQERRRFNQDWLAGLRSAVPYLQLYQVYPAQASADVLVWSAVPAPGPDQPAAFFESYARLTNPHRRYLSPAEILWGFTRPSQYTKTRSTQEIDPFSSERKPYLVIYPFVKTQEWYLMSREARQGMMNEHIKVGKGYPEITQLLLYSFGLQDQEFIVAYETDDLLQFSDLVQTLRATEGRRYTWRDTPLFTAIHHPPAEAMSLWD